MQDEVGDERLLERRREALDELVRQAADEADRVGDEVAAARRARSRASSGRASRTAGRRPRRLRVGERVQERRLAGVRVAGERDRRRVAERARAFRCASRALLELACSRRLSSAIRRRARRRSVSSCDSPGPRVADAPPPRRSRCCHMPRIRGRLYSSCASSTWSLPSALRACWAKMSRISCVRSTTRALQRVLEAPLLARVELVVDDAATRRRTSCDELASAPRACPCPRRCADPAPAGAGRARRPARRRPFAGAPRISPSSSLSSTPGASTATTNPRSGSAPGAGSGWWWLTAAIMPGIRRGAKTRSGEPPPRAARPRQ